MSRTVMQIFYVWISNLVSISTLNSQILASSISLEIQRNVNWNRTRWPITRSHYDEILPHYFYAGVDDLESLQTVGKFERPDISADGLRRV